MSWLNKNNSTKSRKGVYVRLLPEHYGFFKTAAKKKGVETGTLVRMAALSHFNLREPGLEKLGASDGKINAPKVPD